MGIRSFHRLSVLIGFGLLAGCAGSHGALAGPRPREVAVVAFSQAQKPAPQNLFDDIGGAEDPRELMVSESVRALRNRGFEASPARLDRDVGDADVARLAKAAGTDAVFVIRLERFDLSALQPLGKAEVELDARLVSADGKVLWQDAVAGGTHVAMYRSQSDWRSHLRDALDRVLGELP